MTSVKSVPPIVRTSYMANQVRTLRRENQELKEEVRLLRRLTVLDALTGLGNQRGFREKYYELVEGAYRHHRNFSLALIDLDHFGSINNRHGHQAGDRALKTVAGIIQETLRPTDYAARYGGDELVVLLDEAAFGNALTPLAAIRARVGEIQIRGEDKMFRLSVSIGVTTLLAGPNSTWLDGAAVKNEMTRLLEEADRALYFSKRNGRNQINAYSSELSRSLDSLRRTGADLPAIK